MVDHYNTWYRVQELRSEQNMLVEMDYPGATLDDLIPFLLRNFKVLQ